MSRQHINQITYMTSDNESISSTDTQYSTKSVDTNQIPESGNHLNPFKQQFVMFLTCCTI